jgi:hypothetical protein
MACGQVPGVTDNATCGPNCSAVRGVSCSAVRGGIHRRTAGMTLMAFRGLSCIVEADGAASRCQTRPAPAAPHADC